MKPKIEKVSYNNRKRAFEVTTSKGKMDFPYSKLQLKPSGADHLNRVSVDKELGNRAFTYQLKSGKEGSVHIDAILEYHRDPDYVRDILLYQLTVQAQEILRQKKTSKREVIRRLGTSPTQFYRLIDQAFYGKTIDQMIKLLSALDYDVNLSIEKKAA